jgi:hypothetical protein
MWKVVEISGMKFGMLTVLRRADNDSNGKSRWDCLCDCGNMATKRYAYLKQSVMPSCGCYKRKRTSETHSKKNNYEIHEDYVAFSTNKGDAFLIDIDDLEKVKNICWCKCKDGYISGRIRGNKKNNSIRLHDYIMNVPKDMCVDHINHDKSDNRKSNLRVCTLAQNNMNSNGKGVRKRGNRWIAYASINNKYKYIGSFGSFKEAISARANFLKENYGEYANTQAIAEQWSAYLEGLEE